MFNFSLFLMTIVIAVVSLVLTILACVFILPEKRKERLGGFGKLLHNIGNFKSLLIEKILKVVYIFASVFCVLYGLFSLIVNVSLGAFIEGIIGGVSAIVLGPIAIRLVFELSMMFILLVKNVIQINNKLKNDLPVSKAGDKKTVETFTKPYNVPNNFDYNFQPVKAPVETPIEVPAQAPIEAPEVEVAVELQTEHVACSSANFCGNCGAQMVDNKCPNCQQ